MNNEYTYAGRAHAPRSSAEVPGPGVRFDGHTAWEGHVPSAQPAQVAPVLPTAGDVAS